MLYRFDDPLRTPTAVSDRRRARRSRVPLYAAAFLLGLIAAAWLLRPPPLQALTPESLAQAERTWRDAGVHDYDLHFRMFTADYEVEVRSDVVSRSLVNGREPPSAIWGNYSVHGLFKLLHQELENLADPAGPFAASGSVILARVRFHPRFGYPERYLRSGGPAGKTAVIEVSTFRPASPGG